MTPEEREELEYFLWKFHGNISLYEFDDYKYLVKHVNDIFLQLSRDILKKKSYEIHCKITDDICDNKIIFDPMLSDECVIEEDVVLTTKYVGYESLLSTHKECIKINRSENRIIVTRLCYEGDFEESFLESMSAEIDKAKNHLEGLKDKNIHIEALRKIRNDA